MQRIPDVWRTGLRGWRNFNTDITTTVGIGKGVTGHLRYQLFWIVTLSVLVAHPADSIDSLCVIAQSPKIHVAFGITNFPTYG